MKVLAFDLGASSGRAVLGQYADKRLTLTEIHRFQNTPIEADGTLHWDIESLFHAIKEGLRLCAAQGHHDLASIAIDTWGVDYALVGPDGHALGQPIHYRDGRNTPEVMHETLQVLGQDWLYARTGIQQIPINTIFQLVSEKRHHPDWISPTNRLLFMPDYLNYRLTGHMATEYTIASTSGLLNLESASWDLEILAALGLPPEMFLPISQPGTAVGPLCESIQRECGLGPITVRMTASHDTASAVAAIPFAGGQSAFISCGTWSLIGRELREPVVATDPEHRAYTNEGGYGNTIRYLKNISGLWLLQEVMREWEARGQAIDYTALDAAVEAAAPATSFIDPDDPRFMAPGNMLEKIHIYLRDTQQQAPGTQGALARCILESLAQTYAVWIDRLEQVLQTPIKTIHLVGGGARNRHLCQFTTDTTGRPVLAGPTEATAAGNIAVQMIHAGGLRDLAHARRVIRESCDSKPITGTRRPGRPQKPCG